MATPGIGDPYWFEWYVGLKNIINMLNPDNGIEYVILDEKRLIEKKRYLFALMA